MFGHELGNFFGHELGIFRWSMEGVGGDTMVGGATDW